MKAKVIYMCEKYRDKLSEFEPIMKEYANCGEQNEIIDAMRNAGAGADFLVLPYTERILDIIMDADFAIFSKWLLVYLSCRDMAHNIICTLEDEYILF